ncbi:MAG: thioesterase family protein [Melioribacteraceae bacterium]
MEISNYSHKIIEVVKFHEVDMLGVCNNAVYFNYFEDARIKYMQDIKKNYALKEILEENSFFIMVHNECDYIKSAHLDDELNIYSRVEYIKNSSFCFRHIVEKAASESIIAKGGGVVVHIDRSNKKSLPLPQEFYDAVQKFEREVEIQRSANE